MAVEEPRVETQVGFSNDATATPRVLHLDDAVNHEHRGQREPGLEAFGRVLDQSPIRHRQDFFPVQVGAFPVLGVLHPPAPNLRTWPDHVRPEPTPTTATSSPSAH